MKKFATAFGVATAPAVGQRRRPGHRLRGPDRMGQGRVRRDREVAPVSPDAVTAARRRDSLPRHLPTGFDPEAIDDECDRVVRGDAGIEPVTLRFELSTAYRGDLPERYFGRSTRACSVCRVHSKVVCRAFLLSVDRHVAAVSVRVRRVVSARIWRGVRGAGGRWRVGCA